MQCETERTAANKRAHALPATVLTFATSLAAIGLTLALSASGSGCAQHAGASATALALAPIVSAATDFEETAAQPPFDGTPITPVESAGAARGE